MVKKTQVKVTTVGSDGAAVGTGVTDVIVQGKVVRVAVNYHASAPASTDLLIYETHEQVTQYIVNLANQATDINVYPAHVLEKSDGTDWLYVSGEEVPDHYHVADSLTVSVAGSNALTNAVIVDIYYLEDI